jgi:hypothetical protein
MQHKINILIISESIDVNDSSGSKGRVALIQNLNKVGFELKVYHYTRKEITLEGIDCVSIKEQKFTFLYLLSKLQLLIKRLTGWNINNSLENKLGFSFSFLNDSYSIQKALQKENPTNFDWVLTLSKGASFRPHHAILKSLKWHRKWLAYVHDPYPFHCYPKPYDWLMPGYQQKERFFKKVTVNARFILFPSGLLQEWMESFFPAIKSKGVIIPHQTVEISTVNRPLPVYFLKGGFTLLHAGNLMKQRPPQPLVEGFKVFLKQNTDAKTNARLLLIGPASYHKPYLDGAKNKIPQLYVSEGYVNYEEVLTLQEQTTVNVIIEADAEVSPFLPGKFPHCVQANRPILHLGPKRSETVRLLGEKYPYSVANKNSEEIAGLIQKLYKEWKLNPKEFHLNRPDLNDYISPNFLARQIQKLGNID